MTKDEIQKEINELEFELCHDLGLLTKTRIEERIMELKWLSKGVKRLD